MKGKQVNIPVLKLKKNLGFFLVQSVPDTASGPQSYQLLSV